MEGIIITKPRKGNKTLIYDNMAHTGFAESNIVITAKLIDPWTFEMTRKYRARPVICKMFYIMTKCGSTAGQFL